MVQSIAQIPDPIQRSVYIKECARIMDIDENILISEVARKRSGFMPLFYITPLSERSFCI